MAENKEDYWIMKERGENCMYHVGDKIYRYGKRYNIISKGEQGEANFIDLRGDWKDETCTLIAKGTTTIVEYKGLRYKLADVLNTTDDL